MPDVVSSTVEGVGAAACADTGGVRLVDPLADPTWDDRLRDCPSASFFHRSAWARVLHSTYGFSPVYFVQGTGPSCSLLPCMEVNSWISGRRGVSLPFTDECQPIICDGAARRELIRSVFEHATARHWRYLQFHGGRNLFAQAPAAVGFLGHRLAIDRDIADLHSGLDGATRRNVRRASESGLDVEFSTSWTATRTFYGLLCRTRKRQGMPPQPFALFRSLHRHVLKPGLGCIAIATHRKVPVAGAIFLHNGKTALYKFGASDERFQHLRPNNLVMWLAIKWHAARGFETLDFGRTSLGNAGLRRFKLGWGTDERLIEYFKFDRFAGRFVSSPDRSSGWHTPLFRLLPIALARLLGAALYRHAA